MLRLRDKSLAKNEELYSASLMITIPLLAVMIILIIFIPVNRAIQSNEARQAETLAKITAAALRQNSGFPTRLQKQIEEIKVTDDHIASITVVEPAADGSYNVTASTDDSVRGKPTGDTTFTQATKDRKTITTVTKSANGEILQQVITPLIEGDTVLGAIALGVTTKQTSTALTTTVQRSAMFAAGIVLIMIIILLNHMYFVRHVLEPEDSSSNEDNKNETEDSSENDA